MAEFFEQSFRGDPKRAFEFTWFQRTSQIFGSSDPLLFGKIVKASTLHNATPAFIAELLPT